MLVKKFLGKEVIGSGGDKIGKIADFDFDIVSAKIKSVTIRAGLNRSYKINMDDIVTVGDTVIIRFNEDELKKASQKGK